MTQDNVTELLAALSKKVEDQARFNRVLMLLCTSAILGFMCYFTTEVYSSLPQMMFSIDQIQAIYAKKQEAAKTANSAPATDTTAK